VPDSIATLVEAAIVMLLGDGALVYQVVTQGLPA